MAERAVAPIYVAGKWKLVVPPIALAQLNDFATRIFLAAGAPPDIARQVGESLVTSDLYGVRSHGLQLCIAYLARIRAGQLNPQARPCVATESQATALIDGQRAFGQVVAAHAAALAIRKAQQHGFAIVCANNCNHVGRIGAYPEMIAQADLIGFAQVNATTRLVAPHGGLHSRFGTNPLAFAVPVPGDHPVLMDFTTSAVAANKLRVFANRGATIPLGWILDRHGNPSSDPNAFFDGGYLLPMGAHKGHGLLIMVEVLAGLLSGSGSGMLGQASGANGVFLMAIDPAAFRPADEFSADMRRLVDTLRASPARDGAGSVLVPGDPEAQAAADQLRDGIEYDDVTWQNILRAAESVGVK